MDDELSALFQKIAADANRRRLTGVIGVSLEAKPRSPNAFPVTVPNSFCTTKREMRCCCQVFNATTLSQ